MRYTVKLYAQVKADSADAALDIARDIPFDQYEIHVSQDA